MHGGKITSGVSYVTALKGKKEHIRIERHKKIKIYRCRQEILFQLMMLLELFWQM